MRATTSLIDGIAWPGARCRLFDERFFFDRDVGRWRRRGGNVGMQGGDELAGFVVGDALQLCHSPGSSRAAASIGADTANLSEANSATSS